MRCATCQTEVPPSARSCPSCAAPQTLDAETIEPVGDDGRAVVARQIRPPSSSNPSSEDGRGVGLISALAPRTASEVVRVPVDLSGSVAWLAAMIPSGIQAALLLTLLWLLFRISTRRNWLAPVLMIIARFGVLAAVAYYFTFYCTTIGGAPWTTSLSAWYARPALLAIAAILALAIFGFRTTLAGRPLWRDELQPEAA